MPGKDYTNHGLNRGHEWNRSDFLDCDKFMNKSAANWLLPGLGSFFLVGG